jgi:hypothetical protein
MHAPRARSYLFTLRFWPEETSGDHIEWRGKLQQVSSGEMIYFRDWDALVEFLESALGSYTGTDGQVFGFGRNSDRKGRASESDLTEQMAQSGPVEQGRDERNEANT